VENIFRLCLLEKMHAKCTVVRLGYSSNSTILKLWAQVSDSFRSLPQSGATYFESARQDLSIDTKKTEIGVAGL